MGKSVCSFCATEFPSSDFDKGRAVILFKKTYCKKCMDRAVRQKTKNPKHSGHHTADTPR